MKYKIEKGIEIVKPNYGATAKIPLEKMEIGDSILLSGVIEDVKEMNKLQQRVYAYSVQRCKQNKVMNKWKFSTRRTDKGLRIWRVK